MKSNPKVSALIINQKKFTYEEIRQHSYLNKDLDDYERQTLAHCADWLNQKPFFELQTSGSTGKPQSIQVSREQMQQSAQATVQALGLEEGDRALVCINTAFVGGLMMLVRGLAFGLSLYIIAPTRNPMAEIRRQIGDETFPEFEFTALVPWQFQTMLEEETKQGGFIQSMKAIILGGAPVSYALEQKIKLCVPAIYSTYGMTETVSHIALRRLNGEHPQDYYQILPGIQIEQDERDCLKIKGIVTQSQWIQTNDRVELLAEDKFRWLGRSDFVINSGGIKIQGETLERVLEEIFSQLGLNPVFFIAGLPHEELGESVNLFIEGAAWPSEIKAKLTEQMKLRLEKYKTPKEIIFLPEFTRTPTEKIHRLKTISLLNK